MALESNIEGIWFAKQTAKGIPVTMTTGTKRGRWVGGDLQTNRADGNENYSDNTLFGNVEDFINTLLGNGAPVLQAQPGVLAYLAYLAAGQETVTGGVNGVQTIASTATGGTFKLSFSNGFWTWTTAAIAFNAAGSAIVSALQAATSSQTGAPVNPLTAATITAGGGPLPTSVTLTYSGTLAAQPIPLLTADNTAATGGAVTPATTTPGTGYTHVCTPNDNGGFYATVAKSVGKTQVHRVAYNDCRFQSVRLEASSASKIAKITPTFVSFDPGQQLSLDPTQIDDGTHPFIWTEVAGTVTIDGTVFRGTSSMAAVLTWGLQEWYGDDIVPFDVVNLRADATLEAITIIIDANGLARYNAQIYGRPNPAAGDKPIHSLPNLGSYAAQMNKTNPDTGLTSASCKIEFPHVKWNPDLNIPANPDGGAAEFAMAAEFRKTNDGLPPWKITTVNGDPAYTS